MPALLNIAPWESWRTAEYVRDYYGKRVEPDEHAAIQFQVAFLQRAPRQYARAVEYGCGPTLMRAIAASRYVASLDMADRLEGNLQLVSLWAAADPQADDWTRFTEYALRCEGIEQPSPEQILAREQRTRGVLSEFLLTDAREQYPLGQARVGHYDLLISGFCLDCLSQSRAVWRGCMANVLRLVKPGGSFVVLALRNCEGYRAGKHWFPGANISRGDLDSALVECGADAACLEIAECELPRHASQGYEGILMACGQIAG